MSFGPVIRFLILKFFEKTFKLGFSNKRHRFFVSNPGRILYFNRYLEIVMVVDYDVKIYFRAHVIWASYKILNFKIF